MAMNKTQILAFSGGAAIVILFTLWQVFAGDIQVKLQLASKSSWDRSGPELKSRYKAVLDKDFKDILLPNDTINQIVDCMVPKAIKELNQTKCSYIYSKRAMSKAEHLKKQEACLKKANYTQKEERLSKECIANFFPNRWSVFRKIIHREYAKHFDPKLVANPKHFDCVIDRYINTLDKTPCLPINKDPAAKSFWNSADACAERTGILKDIPAYIKDCTLSTKTAATKTK